MNRDLAQQVRERATDCCEYCRMSQLALPLPFQIDHSIAEKHQGYCNRYKGPVIAGNDPDTGHLVRLNHPRHDELADPFGFRGAGFRGKTPIGRTTV